MVSYMKGPLSILYVSIDVKCVIQNGIFYDEQITIVPPGQQRRINAIYSVNGFLFKSPARQTGDYRHRKALTAHNGFKASLQ